MRQTALVDWSLLTGPNGDLTPELTRKMKSLSDCKLLMSLCHWKYAGNQAGRNLARCILRNNLKLKGLLTSTIPSEANAFHTFLIAE